MKLAPVFLLVMSLSFWALAARAADGGGDSLTDDSFCEDPYKSICSVDNKESPYLLFYKSVAEMAKFSGDNLKPGHEAFLRDNVEPAKQALLKAVAAEGVALDSYPLFSLNAQAKINNFRILLPTDRVAAKTEYPTGLGLFVKTYGRDVCPTDYGFGGYAFWTGLSRGFIPCPGALIRSEVTKELKIANADLLAEALTFHMIAHEMGHGLYFGRAPEHQGLERCFRETYPEFFLRGWRQNYDFDEFVADYWGSEALAVRLQDVQARYGIETARKYLGMSVAGLCGSRGLAKTHPDGPFRIQFLFNQEKVRQAVGCKNLAKAGRSSCSLDWQNN